MNMHINIVRIKAVAQVLSSLEEEFVFVGGATVALYIDNPDLADEVRPTDDIDVIVEIATYSGYAALEERLRAIGFVNDVESGVLCRYKIQGIIVDIMPTDENAIGFSNRWYPGGFKNAIKLTLDKWTTVKIFSLPYFVASKWEAYKNRGGNNYRTSKDFEDLVYVFENVESFEDKFKDAPNDLLAYLKSEFQPIVNTSVFKEGLYAHMQSGYTNIDTSSIIEKLKNSFLLATKG